VFKTVPLATGCTDQSTDLTAHDEPVHDATPEQIEAPRVKAPLSSAVTLIRPRRAQNDPATLRDENAQLRRQVQELRALLPTLRTEATALREQIAWQMRWIKELREAVATLTGPEAA
jgi:hypothetical protein